MAVPAKKYHVMSWIWDAPGRGPVAQVRRVHLARGVHKGVVRLDDHLGRGHHVRQGRRARVALRQPQPHRDVVLGALRGGDKEFLYDTTVGASSMHWYPSSATSGQLPGNCAPPPPPPPPPHTPVPV